VKILCIYRHYWPDKAPYGRLLRSLSEYLVINNHDVTIFTAQPSYHKIKEDILPQIENINDVKVIRMNLFPETKKNFLIRIINIILFGLGGIIQAIKNRKYNLVLVNSTPAIIMGFVAFIIKKFIKVPYIYHCQDIHPEAALMAGYLKNKLLYKLLYKLDTISCKNAEVVVVLSEDMANTLKKRGLSGKNFLILNNFIPQEFQPSEYFPSELKKSKEKFQILFAGNIGKFQGLENIIEVARILKKSKGLTFLFIGEGVDKEKLKIKASDLLNKKVFFKPFQPMHILLKVIEESNLCLISLRPGIYRVAFPSKTMTYLAGGCPILALVEQESQLAKFILEEDLGYVCSQKNVGNITNTIKKSMNENMKWLKRRSEIKQIAESHFGREIILKKWSDLIDKII